MGYYTLYKLEFTSLDEGLELSSKEEIETKVINYINSKDPKHEDYLSSFIHNGKFYNEPDEMKWYDHDADMLEMSRNILAVVFTLSGFGEDNEMWRKYYYKGRVQVAIPTVVYPDMDVEYLMGFKDKYKEKL